MWYFLEPEFWHNPFLILLFITSLGAIIYLRYAFVSVLYKAILEKITTTTRNSFSGKRNQIIRELRWALLTSIVFTVLCALSLLLYQQGWTSIYEDIHDYSIAYFIVSPLLILLAYETYYYWLHRWMHRPAIFRIVHKVHHDSLEPTVFTAFSFHPVEAFLQFLFFPLVIVLIPVHLYALAAVFLVLTVSATINHSGVEIYGKGSVVKHIIGSSHHDLHHQEFTTNFGLTLTWWDRAMKTCSKRLSANSKH
jgi:sterol desaturase/sphingolipid hydroxylase (fatty acid hydroxylase superfamily)